MFINETTIVLVFMPVILGVCKERNLPPSRYLLCAAYGAALGKNYVSAINFFEQFGTIGAIVVLVVLVTILVIHHFWGRLTLYRIALHFHRHHAQHKPPATEADVSPEMPS